MKRLMFIATALLAFTLAGDRAGTGLAGSAAIGSLAPGTVIDADNVQRFTQFLNPGMVFAIDHGLKIKVMPTEPVDWPQQYQQATEQHAAQVSLDQTDSLQNYVAGLPFPLISGGDLKAGVKIAYNWRWGPYIPDQVSFSNLASRTYAFSAGDPLSFRLDPARDDSRNELTCDRAIVLRRAHRLEADSRGDDGDGSGVQWEERGDECGPEQGKFIALLYSDANREPDSYVFLEATRRWRRIAVPLVPNQSCSYSCSQLLLEYMPPQAGLYSWKLADRRTMLGCLHGGAALDAGATRFGQISCEPRAVYVVDMVPRSGKSDLLRARLYLDAETYLYLGGEVFRDQSPDLSWAIWTMGDGSSGAKGLVLADDLYVPDDRAGTFMWLDMSQRQNFEDDISANLFNPKAAQ
jgi:hypothetical protein